MALEVMLMVLLVGLGSSHLASTALGFWDDWCQAMMSHRHLPVLMEKLISSRFSEPFPTSPTGAVVGLNSSRAPNPNPNAFSILGYFRILGSTGSWEWQGLGTAWL